MAEETKAAAAAEVKTNKKIEALVGQLNQIMTDDFVVESFDDNNLVLYSKKHKDTLERPVPSLDDAALTRVGMDFFKLRLRRVRAG